MRVQVLGESCPGCRRMLQVTREALDAIGLPIEVEHVTDPSEIAALGGPKIPALLVDGETLVAGWVPATDTVRRLLSDIRV